jgi:3-oxoacyl-[acyl-carrier-protein] synthase-1
MTLMFDAMGALSRRFNDMPERASRPYDSTRDGFVIASGGGVLVLESLDHALSRGARIHAELTGFGHCTDGAGMVSPHASGIARAMRGALDEAGTRPSYINTHAPSTPLGDVEELHALGMYSAMTCRCFHRRRDCPAIRWEPAACTKRSTPC